MKKKRTDENKTVDFTIFGDEAFVKEGRIPRSIAAPDHEQSVKRLKEASKRLGGEIETLARAVSGRTGTIAEEVHKMQMGLLGALSTGISESVMHQATVNIDSFQRALGIATATDVGARFGSVVRNDFRQESFESFLYPRAIPQFEMPNFAQEKVERIITQIEEKEFDVQVGKQLLVFVEFGADQLPVGKRSFNAINRHEIEIRAYDGSTLILGHDKISLRFVIKESPNPKEDIVH